MRWVVPVASALLTAGCFGAGVQDGADREAAGFADSTLLRGVTEATDAIPAEERLTAVRRWLESPDEEFLVVGLSDWSWIVREISANELSITVYYNWEDKSFSAAQAWGVACRVYRVDTTVTVRAVECPEGTEPSPGTQDGLVGWYYRR
ncbi:MAG: hypothetical protein ACRCY8_18520 [Dermatophilaceae bacterium]